MTMTIHKKREKVKKRTGDRENLPISPPFPHFPTSPSQLKGDLDNIILMALRKEPYRRYVSVADFSDDISNYLNGLPVNARPNTFFYRASKFYTRNKVSTIIGLFLILSLVAGIITTTWQIFAVRQQRDRAEKRFQDVRQLSNSLLFEITPKIERLPGSTEAREIIIQRALKYLDELAAESENDFQLQKELALAYEKIGDLQGNPANPNLIMLDEAIKSYQKAQNIRQKLFSVYPQDKELQAKIAENRRLLGNAYGQTNDYQTEFENLNKAAETYTQLVAEQPQANDLQIALAQTNYDLGVNQTSLNAYGGAIPFYDKAISILENLIKTTPQNVEAQRLLGLTYAQKSYSLSWEDRQNEAETEMAKAVALLERIFAQHQTDTKISDSLSLVYWLGGNINEEINNRLFYEFQAKAVRVMRETVKRDAADLRAKQHLAKTLSHLGQASINIGRIHEAILHLEESREIFQNIIESKTRNSRLKAEFSNCLTRLGTAQAKLGDLQNGIKSLEQAEHTYREIIEQFPFDKRSANNLASAYAALAQIYEKNPKQLSNSVRLAKVNYQKALEVMLDLEYRGVLSEYDRKFLEEMRNAVQKFSAL